MSNLREKMEKNRYSKLFVIGLCCKNKKELNILEEISLKKDLVLSLGLIKTEKDKKYLNERLKGDKQSAEMSKEYAFKLDNIGVNGKPLFIIPIESKFRRFTTIILRSPYYDWLIISIIFINCIQLALDNPLVDP